VPEAAPWAPLGPTVLVTVVASFFVVGQLHMVIPLSHAMARDWHAGTASVTWVATLFALTYAVGQLVFGPLSDRLGRRAVMTSGLLAMAAVTAAIGTADSLATGLVLRGLQGFGAASFAVVALAYVADRVEPGPRAIALTALTSSFFAAAIVGQVVAQSIEALLGWRAVFWGSAAVLVAVALCLRAVLLPDAASTRTSLRTTVGVMGALVLDRRMALLLVATVSVLGGFVALYMGLELMGPPGIVGDEGALLALRASGLPAIVAVPLCAPLLARYRPTLRAIVALLAAAAITAGLLVVGNGVVAIGLLLVLFVAAIAVLSPALVEAIGSHAASARGSSVALCTFFLLLGASAGPQLVSLLHGRSFDTLLLVLVAMFLGAAVLVAAADRPWSGRSDQPAVRSNAPSRSQPSPGSSGDGADRSTC
jgi:predicted MFS family arabinose efflux permease